MTRAISHQHATRLTGTPSDAISLAHDERHLRRKLLVTQKGAEILVDFPSSITLEQGDALELENGELIGIIAASEPVMRIKGRDRRHLQALCWHLGNRHLPTQIEEDVVIVRRDHVIRDMLIGLGAEISDTDAPFSPERGAYHSHGNGAAHSHG